MIHRLAKHIELQLLQHHCAVLPSLGGFVLESVPARFDAEGFLAYPPGVRVYFNEALTHHDGLLTESYAHRYGVSLRRARIMLEEDVRQLRQTLIQARHYNLEGIGTLSLGTEGQITFSASASARLNAPSYGLSPIALPDLLADRLESDATDGPEADRSARDEQYIHLRIPRTALRYAAVAVLALLTLLLPWEQPLQQAENFTAGFIQPKQAVEMIATTLSPEPVVAEKPASAPETAPNHLTEPVTGRHYVIIATEKVLDRAEGHYARAEGSDFPELKILPGRSVYRVSVASFATPSEAYQFISTLGEDYTQAWVYTHK